MSVGWRVEVSESAPASVLRWLSSVALEWPGEDELEVVLGGRTLLVRLRDCEETRREIGRLIGGM